MKISHEDPAVVTNVIDILNKRFGKVKPLTVKRGKVFDDYQGMRFDFPKKGKSEGSGDGDKSKLLIGALVQKSSDVDDKKQDSKNRDPRIKNQDD